MELITLNAWGGRLGESLLQFLGRLSSDVDIICLQEVPSTGKILEGSKEWSNANKVADDHAVHKGQKVPDLYKEICRTLPEFNAFVSPQYSSTGESLATFVNNRLDVMQSSSSRAHPPLRIDYRLSNGEIVPYEFNSPVFHISIWDNGVALNIINVHGLWQPVGKVDTRERLSQSAFWTRLLTSLPGKRVLCGDLNLYPDTKSIKKIEESGMRNLIKEYKIDSTRSEMYDLQLRARGKEPTKKDWFADYVFVSKDIKVLDFKAINQTVSDHLPLLIKFK